MRLPLPERAEAIRDTVAKCLSEPGQAVNRFGDRWEAPAVSPEFQLERVDLRGSGDSYEIAVLFRWAGETDLFGMRFGICAGRRGRWAVLRTGRLHLGLRRGEPARPGVWPGQRDPGARGRHYLAALAASGESAAAHARTAPGGQTGSVWRHAVRGAPRASLRVKLVAVALCLLAAGAAVILTVGASALRGQLIRQAGGQLRAYAYQLAGHSFQLLGTSQGAPAAIVPFDGTGHRGRGPGAGHGRAGRRSRRGQHAELDQRTKPRRDGRPRAHQVRRSRRPGGRRIRRAPRSSASNYAARVASCCSARARAPSRGRRCRNPSPRFRRAPACCARSLGWAAVTW